MIVVGGVTDGDGGAPFCWAQFNQRWESVSLRQPNREPVEHARSTRPSMGGEESTSQWWSSSDAMHVQHKSDSAQASSSQAQPLNVAMPRLVGWLVPCPLLLSPVQMRLLCPAASRSESSGDACMLILSHTPSSQLVSHCMHALRLPACKPTRIYEDPQIDARTATLTRCMHTPNRLQVWRAWNLSFYI